ncbi:hypothetical protein [Polaribacter sp.]|uniref:hypothetical protein n=1 Tax=Polaribacter sp. TaxID=1920175 RepID=UPI0040470EA2
MVITVKKKHLWLDTFMILLNLSYSYSIIPHIVFFQYSRAYSTLIVFVVNCLFIFFRFKRSFNFRFKSILFSLFISINILNLIFGTLTGTYGYGMAPFIFSNLTFYFILHNLFTNYKIIFDIKTSLWLILRGYVYLSLISVVGVVIIFLLIKIYGFVPNTNDIGETMNLFESNLRDPNFKYYLPGNLSVLMEYNEIRLPFFQEYGILTGLYHEPHIMTFLITPSYFILLGYIKANWKKILTTLFYILALLISTSATNLMALMFLFFIYFFIFRKKDFLFLIVSCLIFSSVFIAYGILKDSIIFNFILEKLSSGSFYYSNNTISYAFSPKSLIGTSFYNLEYLDTYWNFGNKSMDVGYIIFILNIFFLFFIIRKIYIINLKIDYEKSFYIGLSFIYFFLHSMKINMYSYSLSYTLFMIFLISIIIKNKFFLKN